ncbi:hypothetical protein [Flavobacterium facile]|uniref:hypothetical protein n=1 Tax=Flavobacterium facile TaxID=2893174 RepID=UPI002E7717E2|nr:hypothetical protein [Flavobacterium sp. T-12]
MNLQLDIKKSIQPLIYQSKKIRRENSIISTVKIKIDNHLTDLILLFEGYFNYVHNLDQKEVNELLLKLRYIGPILKDIENLLVYVNFYDDKNLKEKMTYFQSVIKKIEKELLLQKNNLVMKTEVKEYPVSKNIPNTETLKAMTDTENGIGLTKVKNRADFYKKMNL